MTPNLTRRRTTALTSLALAGLLAAPAVAGDPSTAVAGDPVAIAKAFLVDEALRRGFAPSDVAELKVTDAYSTAANGVTHVYFQQLKDGTPVALSNAGVHVAADGEVFHSGLRLVKGTAAASGTASLTPAAAAGSAARALGLPAPRGLRVLGTKETSTGERLTLLSDGGISLAPIPVGVVYQARDAGAPRLAYRLEIQELSGLHWWSVAVDAQTGALLEKDDFIVNEWAGTVKAAHDDHAGEATGSPVVRAASTDVMADITPVKDGAKYRVYAQPLESPNDGPRTKVTNPADPLFSPLGWHDLDGKAGPDTQTTRGNNTDTYADTVQSCEGLATGVCAPAPNNNEADPGSQPTSATLDFDYVADERLTPATYRDAAVTNLFYWTNTIHDFAARYGFDEAAGNFQVVNYSGQGKGGDSVQAEAQDGSGVLNANFGTPAEGSEPRMQMYLWVPGAEAVLPNPQRNVPTRPEAAIRDGDFDAGVIAHEYGHGISNRLTGGPATTGCLSTTRDQEQMGEGWSDFFGYTMTMRAEDALDFGATPRGIGTYVIYQEGRKAQGIRQTAYSTDMEINYATYDTIKDSSVAAPHGVGWVWSSMLWEVYWNLVKKHGFNADLDGAWSEGGNNLALQLVMDGMKFQPCLPGFVDGRDGILAADRALTGGANQCEIWRGFAKRGLGTDAKQGAFSSKTDGKQGFRVPEGC